LPALESGTTILGLVGLALLAAGGFYARARNPSPGPGTGEEQAGARS
jgi:LPXTG-motif cell wall-anchored protein